MAPFRDPCLYKHRGHYEHALLSRSCTSSRWGRLGMAPLRVTQMLAAAEAKRSASAPTLPSSVATPNAAVKQSPAPVVSTT